MLCDVRCGLRVDGCLLCVACCMLCCVLCVVYCALSVVSGELGASVIYNVLCVL